ncbi:MAG: hypothetical protein A2684_00680 [Candidatus Levybacteria bacterium RIFCSPHIGHO2_01_FULL_36_15b]|nr:MAG: hypothetical protein A2684_00680 [Candidatus Levybacteria bacterium RIFCSPHIGHO2_01_FULL_36_15b]
MSRLETSLGIFEAHIRREHVDIERNGSHEITYLKSGIVDRLREKRRIAELISSSSGTLKAPAAVAVTAYDSSVGLMRGEGKRVIRGLVLGVLVGKALDKAETIFQRDADLAGIHQEAIENAS